MATVFVNIGSNLGNRRLNLSRAMRAINAEFGDFEMSHVVESEPWGFASPHPFLNVGIAFSTDRTPREVLSALQGIEKSIDGRSHRDASGGYADRTVDIDIMAIDREVIDEEDLKVPHPHLRERRFFLEPMCELAAGWRDPESGMTPMEMLAQLSQDNKE